jgi:hypothetical protein
MEQSEVIQIEAAEDGCLYVYTFATDLWTKVSRIASFNALPWSVKDRLRVVVQGTRELDPTVLSDDEIKALMAALNAKEEHKDG